ncbi:MAG: hypothetical protein ACRC6A_01925 [Fusobacteriaceae bacterium]
MCTTSITIKGAGQLYEVDPQETTKIIVEKLEKKIYNLEFIKRRL